ncbi:hypothetical protein [Bifidobacterium samirii]|uniref:Uncharacterized protein n=1 Tax=Bifidobacterium samirii TaxID=2306974 RepID=A0A430FUB4_9BIFI|nr:hypothetical protein [Bifidobacterium samirii]RSX56749.1 hypothetical protein D2E24_1039 [Bifidobacterium samirii]
MIVRLTLHLLAPAGPVVHERLIVDGRPASLSPAVSPMALAAVLEQLDDSVVVRHIDIEREAS